jgi:hypothetical protein
MATIKSYIDIEQSKKLAEILPLESADNVIVSFGDRYGVKTVVMPKETLDVIRTPFADIRKTTICWSLTALLGVLESEIDGEDGETYLLNIEKDGIWWNVWYREQYDTADPIETEPTEELIDACYELILKLHELKML